jgi:hypothetical protein
MQSMRQDLSRWRWGALTLLVIAGALAVVGAMGTGTVIHDRWTARSDTASGFSRWTWLPGQRAIWVSRRAACRAETTTKACEGDHGTGVRLVYYGPEVPRAEIVLPLPTP